MMTDADWAQKRNTLQAAVARSSSLLSVDEIQATLSTGVFLRKISIELRGYLDRQPLIFDPLQTVLNFLTPDNVSENFSEYYTGMCHSH